MLGVVLSVTIAELFSLTAALTFLAYTIYTYRNDGLRHIPPVHWSVPWSRFHILYIKYFYSTKTCYYDAHRNCPEINGFRPLVRVGPKEVCGLRAFDYLPMVSRPLAWRAIKGRPHCVSRRLPDNGIDLGARYNHVSLLCYVDAHPREAC